jgi:hypothetical protein
MDSGSSGVSTESEVVHGLRAAARFTGWSPSGVQKLVDGGRLVAQKDDRGYVFSVADLSAIRRDPAASTPPIATSVPASPAMGEDREVAPESSDPSCDAVTSTAGADDGAVAAIVFSDLRAGKSLVDIVAERRIAPDVVRKFHAQWLALSDTDALRRPTAEARLVEAEADIQTLDSRLSAAEAAIEEVNAEHGRAREVERRVRSLETRGRATSVPAAVLQRLDTLEQQIRSLPTAPMPIGRCCPSCGAAVIVATACSGCGAGRAVG